MTSILNAISIQSSSLRKKKSQIEIEQEQTAVPDSTTNVEKERFEFNLGQDVLLKHKDGCYYLGTVIATDTVREQCLVKFGDNTQSWSNIKNLKKPKPKQEDLLLCVVCKKSAPKDNHEITVCDTCSRGYHQSCHDPKIPNDCQKDGNLWMCKRCWNSESIRRRKNIENKLIKKENARKLGAGIDRPHSSIPLSFSYNIDALTWDAYHRVNFEKIYCYCGGNGEWYTQMLQCSRCRQWFHEKCIKCLRYPLYCGDRFYVFVCAICNDGIEFLRRLELNWVELVHLMLFNLTAFNVMKYYDLDSVIIPYINDNWHALQLPPKIYTVSKYDRRNNILSVLTNNRNRFKCGREMKKRTAIWGLRVRLPPPAPCIHVPPTGPINEEQLRQLCQNSRKLRFLPLENIENVAENSMIVPVDNHMLSLMMGTAYLENAQSESESPCPSPVAEQEEFGVECKYKLFKTEFRGGGCAKKSVPFPKISLQRKKRMLTLNNRERDKSLRKQKQNCGKVTMVRKNGDEGSYRSTTKKLSLDTKSRNSESLPLTPPTSVSAPPTPPASNNFVSGSDFTIDDCEHLNTFAQNFGELTKSVSSKLTKSNLTRNNLSSRLESNSIELNTPCDTSGDETSSKSTLDLIIPPPKDFKGKNNPFLALLRGNNQKKKRRSKDAITLPLPLTAVIPCTPIIRPMKRQLSEKDICIGPNGEVKRRRLRRGRVNQLTAFTAAVPTASKTATVVPVRPDAKEWGQRNVRSSLNQNSTNRSQIGNCVDYALNARRIRNCQEKNSNKEKSSNLSSSKQSPTKQEPEIDMDDLKSSVNIYFGAANRIAVGERFCVKAKRISSNGKLQYLMEWQGSCNGLT